MITNPVGILFFLTPGFALLAYAALHFTHPAWIWWLYFRRDYRRKGPAERQEPASEKVMRIYVIGVGIGIFGVLLLVGGVAVILTQG